MEVIKLRVTQKCHWDLKLLGYLMFNNAYRQGLRCIFTYDGKVIAYVSRQLKKYEINYPTYDLELAAVVVAIKIRRHYLYRETYQIFTDHKAWSIFPLREI